MNPSLRLGKIFGIPIGINYSWFLIFLLVAISLAYQLEKSHPTWSSAEQWTLGTAGSILLFCSVLVHELSHSLLAIRMGLPVHGITLFIFGGVSHMEREAPKPSTELLVAAAGPATSIVLGLTLLGAAEFLDPVSVHLSALA